MRRDPSGVIARSRSLPLMLSAAVPDEASDRRETRGGTGRVANHVSVVATAATPSTTPVIATARSHGGLRGCGAADTVPAGGARLAPFSRTNSAVEMSATRCRRALVRQL